MEPLADVLLKQDVTSGTAEELAEPFVNEELGVKNAKDALAGAQDIIAERISDDAELRKKLRRIYLKNGEISTKIQKAEEEAAAAIAEARQQANEIVEQANNRKNQILEEGRQEGITRGYEEGLLQAQEEIQAQKDELSGQQLKKEQEYQQMLAETEGRYVDVLCNLIRKLSGVILTDRKDVILHLIRSGIADMEPAKHYIIRVASDDLLYVEGEKDALMEKAGITGTIEVQEEKSLSEGDCIIETDNQMIDCGFRTQLDNMVRTLRMLV